MLVVCKTAKQLFHCNIFRFKQLSNIPKYHLSRKTFSEFSNKIPMTSASASAICSEIDSIISLVQTGAGAIDNDINHIIDEKEEEKKSTIATSNNSNNSNNPGTKPNDRSMDLDLRVSIALSVGEETITELELRNLLNNKLTRPIAYDGFEPSGRMHIAQGILKAINVNKLTSIGCDFVFWVADWFALLNNKMGGDINKIRIVGKYMIEVWKAAGMNMDNVYFKWCSDDINNNSNQYWLRVIEISKIFSINRTKRCCTILGRTESDDMPTANLLYAAMQCSDIFHLRADICQLGMDQRKVNMLAREYAIKYNSNKKNKKNRKIKIYPPIVISHHMLMGLKEGQEKMSKSMKDSAIFMEDEYVDIKRKIKKAYAPPMIVKGNPILDYTKYLVFGKYNQFIIKRQAQNGGDITYNTYNDLEKDYISGDLHPNDLKPALADSINNMIEPVRTHFQNNIDAKKLLKQVKKFRVTR